MELAETTPIVGFVSSEVLTEVQRLRARRMWLAADLARSAARANELRRRVQVVHETLSSMSDDQGRRLGDHPTGPSAGHLT